MNMFMGTSKAGESAGRVVLWPPRLKPDRRPTGVCSPGGSDAMVESDCSLEANAIIPAGSTAWYLNLVDEAGLVVSGEHAVR